MLSHAPWAADPTGTIFKNSRRTGTSDRYSDICPFTRPVSAMLLALAYPFGHWKCPRYTFKAGTPSPSSSPRSFIKASVSITKMPPMKRL